MLMGSDLAVTKGERDLQAVVNSNMKMVTWCTAAVKKANSILGIIWKGIQNKLTPIVMPLDRITVQMHLVYCV